VRGSGRGTRLADHLDVGLVGEQAAYPPPEDFVIIDEEHADPARLSAVFVHPPSPFRAGPAPWSVIWVRLDDYITRQLVIKTCYYK
jgi:hypothetical protein